MNYWNKIQMKQEKILTHITYMFKIMQVLRLYEIQNNSL